MRIKFCDYCGTKMEEGQEIYIAQSFSGLYCCESCLAKDIMAIETVILTDEILDNSFTTWDKKE